MGRFDYRGWIVLYEEQSGPFSMASGEDGGAVSWFLSHPLSHFERT